MLSCRTLSLQRKNGLVNSSANQSFAGSLIFDLFKGAQLHNLLQEAALACLREDIQSTQVTYLFPFFFFCYLADTGRQHYSSSIFHSQIPWDYIESIRRK